MPEYIMTALYFIFAFYRFKIKANPLNMRVLKGPIKPAPVEKKPTTVPEPFKLTSVPHKVTKTLMCLSAACDSLTETSLSGPCLDTPMI